MTEGTREPHPLLWQVLRKRLGDVTDVPLPEHYAFQEERDAGKTHVEMQIHASRVHRCDCSSGTEEYTLLAFDEVRAGEEVEDGQGAAAISNRAVLILDTHVEGHLVIRVRWVRPNSRRGAEVELSPHRDYTEGWRLYTETKQPFLRRILELNQEIATARARAKKKRAKTGDGEAVQETLLSEITEIASRIRDTRLEMNEALRNLQNGT